MSRYKILGQQYRSISLVGESSFNSPWPPQPLYVVPNGKQAVVRSLIMHTDLSHVNALISPNPALEFYRVFLVRNWTPEYTFNYSGTEDLLNETVTDGSTKIFKIGITLGAGDALFVDSPLGITSFTAFGVEF